MADLRDRIRQRLDGGESEPDLRSRIRSRLSGGARTRPAGVTGVVSQLGKAAAYGGLQNAAGAVEGAALAGGEAVKAAPGLRDVVGGSIVESIGRRLGSVGIDNPLAEAGMQTVRRGVQRSEAAEPVRATIADAGMKMGEQVRAVAERMGYERSPGALGLAEDTAGAIPQLAGGIGAGLAGGAVGGPLAGMATAAGWFAMTDAGSQTGDIYRRLVADGKSKAEASALATEAGTVYGVASGALEFAGIGTVLRGTKLMGHLGKSAAARVAGAGVGEGVTEAAQGVLGDAAKAWAQDDWDEFGSTWNDLDTRGREFMVGALLGTAVRGGVEALAPGQYESAAEMLADIEVVPNAGSPEGGPSQAPAATVLATDSPQAASSPTGIAQESSPQTTPTVSIRLRGVGAPQPDSRLGDGTPVFKGRAAAEEYVRFKNERRIPGDPILRATPGEGGMVVVPDTRLDERRAEIGTQDQEWSRAERLMQRQVGGQPGVVPPRQNPGATTNAGAQTEASEVGTVRIPRPGQEIQSPAEAAPQMEPDRATLESPDRFAGVSPSASQPPSPESIAPPELASPHAGGESVASGAEVANEPTVTLYRAQPSRAVERGGVADWIKESPEFARTQEAAGRWFTDSRDEAQWYIDNEYPGGEIVTVEIPASTAEQWRVSNLANKPGNKDAAENPAAFSRRPDREFFIPRDVATMAMPMASPPVESMTRPQLLSEAARLGVLEGVKTAPKLRERVAAARVAGSPIVPQGSTTGRSQAEESGTVSTEQSSSSPQSTPAAEQGKKPLVPREQDMMLEASEMTAAERRAQSAWIRATFGAELATPLASEGGISPAQIGQMRKKEHARWQANAQKRMGLESRLRDLARTDEDLRAESAREVEKKNASRVTQLESMVQTWKNVGKGKTGKIRPTYQKLIDEAEAEITSLQPPPPAQQQDLVLWGRRAGEPWVKLGDNTSRAEMVRREKDGWEVLRYPKGESPEMPAQQQERQAEAPVAETVGVEMRPVKNKPIPRSAKFVGEFRKGDANDYVGQLWKLADGTYRVYDQMNMKATKESRPLAANELERSGGMNLSASQSVRFFRLRGTPAEAKTPRAPSAPDRGVFGQIAASPMTAGQMVMPQVKYKDTESAAPTTFTPTGDEVDTEIREKFDEADVPALPFGDVQDTAEGVANPQKGIEQTFSKAEVRKILDAEFGGVTRPGNKGKVARPQGEGLVESTAQGMVSDYLRLLGRVYGMDARGELMREDTGALVGLDSSKLNVGDRFTLDHESVEVVEADDQAVTVRIGDGEHEIKLRGDVAISGIPVEDVYGVQRGKLIPANKGSLVQGKPSKKKGTGRIRDIANRMEAEARAANAKLNIPRGRNIGATLPPAYYANLVKIMAAKILRGAARFADVAAEMVKSEGDWIEEHLRDIWNDADRLASEISEGTEVENPTTARVVQRVEQRRKAESEATSARMVDMDEDRANLGLDALDSPARRSWQDALDTADARGLSEIHRALQLSAEVINTPRAYSDIETAGLVKAAADLKSQHRALLAAISVTKDAAELAGKAAELHGLEDQFDTISTALRKSGTEKGRALASQKLALDSDMSLIAVKARAKAAKGAELTAEESAKIEELTTALEAANTKAAELEAKLKTKTAEAALRKNQESKPKRPKPTREAEFASKLARAKELLSMGCR